MIRALVLVVLGLALAGCGESRESRTSEPRLPAALAADLATRAEDVAARAAAGDPCAAREQAVSLQRATVAAINARRVPPALQEPLLTSVNNLADRLVCSAPPAQTTPAAEPDENDDEGEGKGKSRGKGKGRKK